MAMMKTSGLPVAFSWQDAWAGLPPRERAELMARQGHRYPLLEGLDGAAEAGAGGAEIRRLQAELEAAREQATAAAALFVTCSW